MPNYHWIKGLAQDGWKIINSNIVSGIFAAAAGHVLTKSYRDLELTELQEKNDQLIDRNNKLDNELKESNETNKKVEFALTDRSHQLQTCRQKASAILNDFEQSYCF